MSKKHSINEEPDEEYNPHNGYYDEIVQRRKLKKMKNALKSKNIDYLIDLEDEL